jgi:hypothetical protein
MCITHVCIIGDDYPAIMHVYALTTINYARIYRCILVKARDKKPNGVHICLQPHTRLTRLGSARQSMSTNVNMFAIKASIVSSWSSKEDPKSSFPLA